MTGIDLLCVGVALGVVACLSLAVYVGLQTIEAIAQEKDEREKDV